MKKVLNPVVSLHPVAVALDLNSERSPWFHHGRTGVENVKDCTVEIRADIVGDCGGLSDKAESRQKVVRQAFGLPAGAD